MPHKLITVPSKKEKLPLSVTHPELAKQADGWDASSITPGSSKKLPWICHIGHKWETSPKHRKNGTGCPVCAGQKIVLGINDLKTTNPDLADEADGWNPATNSHSYSKKYNWKCKKGHRWEASISSRKKGSGCPSCAGVRVTSGENDLATNFPGIAKEVVGLDPKTLSISCKRKVNWKCSKGHIFVAAVSDRTRGQGCGVCAGKQIQIGVNDLQANYPEFAKEAYEWDPRTSSSKSNKMRQWKCKRGHIWLATPNSRIAQNTGCAICNGRKLLVGFNDLKSKFPLLANEADGWDPSNVLAGSNLKKKWKCSLGHNWETQINIRVSQKTGCPVCSGHKLSSGFNDLASKYPNLAKEADGWDPRKVSGGTHAKLDWKCAFGHKWNADVHSRASGVGCPICKNKKILVGFNDLQTTHPIIALEADGWDPSSVIAGNNSKRDWVCSYGHKWKASPVKRTFGERGCPSCAQTGFDPNQEGFLYFLKQELWQMLQIGITNFPDDRIKKHMGTGWELIELRGPMDGHLTQQWETAILRMLKAKGADLSNDKIVGKFDGYSEAWSQSTFEVKSIKDLMRLTEEFEAN